MRYIYALMKHFSIMETQHNLARVLREADRAGGVTITRRKKPVARIVPIRDERPTFPDFAARARKTWLGGWRGASSEELLDASRGER